jgi:hypothetical protein
MGLINLKTDLKSLRYGNDRIGGGDSGQPYITTDIPDEISPYIGITDFLLRGGINAASDSLEDIRRLGKMFADTKSPNGLLFVAKQQLLSRTAVRTQTSGVLNEGIYTPLSTLSQAGLIIYGNHLNKQGDPFANSGAYSVNEALYGVKVKPSQPIAENRLAELLRGSYQGRSVDYDGSRVILNNGSINVMTYTGGPGSNLGEGNTNIRYSTTSQTPLTRFPQSYNFTSTENSVGQNDWAYSSELLETQPTQITQNGTASPKAQDFRKVLREKLGEASTEGKKATQSGATAKSLNYSGEDAGNIEKRVNLGDPGQRANKSYASYESGVIDLATNTSPYPNINIPNIGSATSGLDKITSIPIYRSEGVAQDSEVNDFVKFRIAVIDNDSPNFKTFMHFRAFLGAISDSYNATWNPYTYLGRGESFYTYNGFTRNISLSWTVAAQSKPELIAMYKKLNYLASSLTPDYSPKGYMRGNLVQLTIGGYIYEQPGIITGLTYEMQDDTPWEIGIGTTPGSEDPTVKELPHIIRVTGFNFIPIQRFLPQTQNNRFGINNSTSGSGFVNSYGPERYIALANGFGKQNNNYDTSL